MKTMTYHGGGPTQEYRADYADPANAYQLSVSYGDKGYAESCDGRADGDAKFNRVVIEGKATEIELRNAHGDVVRKYSQPPPLKSRYEVVITIRHVYDNLLDAATCLENMKHMSNVSRVEIWQGSNPASLHEVWERHPKFDCLPNGVVREIDEAASEAKGVKVYRKPDNLTATEVLERTAAGAPWPPLPVKDKPISDFSVEDKKFNKWPDPMREDHVPGCICGVCIDERRTEEARRKPYSTDGVTKAEQEYLMGHYIRLSRPTST